MKRFILPLFAVLALLAVLAVNASAAGNKVQAVKVVGTGGYNSGLFRSYYSYGSYYVPPVALQQFYAPPVALAAADYGGCPSAGLTYQQPLLSYNTGYGGAGLGYGGYGSAVLVPRRVFFSGRYR